MKTLGELSHTQLKAQLAGEGVRFRVGPYIYSVESRLPEIAEGLGILYRDFELLEPGGFCDFHLALRPDNILHRVRRKIDFYLDNQRPFSRLKRRHAWAFLEWGMNWCVSVCTNEYLKLHAAVVAKDGVAMIMPGLPGAGKSTLCAALALNGWRVLSDEHALIVPGTSDVVPLCRPVSLKNESIDIIRSHYRDVEFGPRTEDTHKGAVVHMKADMQAHSHDSESIPVRLLVFPQYATGESLSITPRGRAESFMFAGLHSFNYNLLSASGFQAMSVLIDAAECHNLRYGDLGAALRGVEDLHAGVNIR